MPNPTPVVGDHVLLLPDDTQLLYLNIQSLYRQVAIVVKVNSPTNVNLKVFTDSDAAPPWFANVEQGTERGQWGWIE